MNDIAWIDKLIKKLKFKDKNITHIDMCYGECIEGLEELKEYKQLEEQGLLLKFDCAIGDTVYRINSLNEIYECTVQGIKQEFNTTSYFLHVDINKGDYSIKVDNWFDRCQIGYEFYLTKEAAEQELERMKIGK